MSITRDGRSLGLNSTVAVDVPIGAIMALGKGKGCVEGDAAIIRISPITGQYHGRVIKLIDLRPASHKIAQAIMRLNLAEKHAGEWLEDGKFGRAKTEAKEAWDQAFMQPAAITLGTEIDEKTKRKYPVVYLSEPANDKPSDGFLAITLMTTGTGIGAYTYRADYPGSYMRKAAVKDKDSETMYFAMVTFSKIDAPVMIIERNFGEDELLETEYILKDQLRIMQRVMAVMETKWLVGEADETEEVEEDDLLTEHPTVEYAAKLGLTAEEAGAVIEGGFDTLEKIIRAKADVGTATEAGIAKAKWTKVIKAAKEILPK